MNAARGSRGSVTASDAGGPAVAAPGGSRGRGTTPRSPAAKQGDDGYSYIYEARRPVKVGDRIYQPGEEVPGVEDWPRPESWIHTGRIVRLRVRKR